jgi:flagellar basal body-associated protein FliL
MIQQYPPRRFRIAARVESRGKRWKGGDPTLPSLLWIILIVVLVLLLLGFFSRGRW